MRLAFAALIMVGAAALISGQPPKDPPPKGAPPKGGKDDEYVPPKAAAPRYGVNPRVKAFPQSTPKETLRSALEAIEKAEYAYLAAHLLDATVVDAAVAERARQFEDVATKELTRLRDIQQANPQKFPPETRLPLGGDAFAVQVNARARDLAFQRVAKDLEQKLSQDPLSVKDMRRILYARSPFNVGNTDATASSDDVKGRVLYFKKVEDRWFLENRSEPEAAAPKKEP